MKKNKYFLISLLMFAALLQSCEDLNEVKDPGFNVSVISKTIKVGEEVEFKVDNAPDFLMFYPGNFGYEYKHKSRVNAQGKVKMSFLNSQKWGLGANAKGLLTVWYSKDYDGSNTAESIKKATWTEISKRFNISTLYDLTLQESGVVDITDLADGKNIYFAFKYLCDNVSSRPAEWWIDDLMITMDVENAPAPFTVATERQPGFNSIDVQGIVSGWNANKWYFDSGKGKNGLWRMRGAVKKDGAWIVNEDWLITNAINLTKVNPDKGIPLKTFSEQLKTFTHTYDKPGTYTLTFVGNNTTVYGSKEKKTRIYSYSDRIRTKNISLKQQNKAIDFAVLN